MSRIAIYPGSFDPPTLAHQEIYRQAEDVFDRVFVVIARNSSKANMFGSAERMEMWREVISVPENVWLSDAGECVTDWARAVGANYVVRGVRDASDVLGEQVYRKFVKGVSLGGLECVYFMPPPELQCVSSSAVRQILALKRREACAGWLDPRVTKICLPGPNRAA